MAAREGPKAVKYVEEAHLDDEKLYNLLQSYSEARPEATESHLGRKHGTWSCIKYVERVTAASGLVRDVVGEMMWEKLYLELEFGASKIAS